jgi:hypothetical protein
MRSMRGACFIAIVLVSGIASAAPARRPARSAHPVAPAAPGAPEPAWALDHDKNVTILYYGLPNQENLVIAFSCLPRSGDISIRVPDTSGKTTVDKSQSLSLTIGGVRSSFAGTVSADEKTGGVMLGITVTARNPLFTALGGPGGLRIEGKGFTKVVPLKAIGAKLNSFLGACKRA